MNGPPDAVAAFFAGCVVGALAVEGAVVAVSVGADVAELAGDDVALRGAAECALSPWSPDHNEDHRVGERPFPADAAEVPADGAPARTATARTRSATSPVTGTVNESRRRRAEERAGRGAA